jgi:hypothetical protein
MAIFDTDCDSLEEKFFSSINKKQVVSQLQDGCLILGIKVSERHFGTRRDYCSAHNNCERFNRVNSLART